MLKISVPATTANIGPGFDCLGIALNLSLQLTIKKTDGPNRCLWPSHLPAIPPGKNLICKTINRILKKEQRKISYEIKILDNEIPVSRGLGSSAAAIAAGVYGANYLLGDIYSEKELITLASDFEGHPDNIIPAIVGGCVISKKINPEEYYYSSINFPKTLNFITMIPDFEVSTKDARNILPEAYSMEDVIENLSNLGILINELNNNRVDYLKYLFNDKIHEPYRIQLINNGEAIMQKMKDLGCLGQFISGSGPTLIGLATENPNACVDSLKKYTEGYADQWKIKLLTLNTVGITTEVI